MRALLSRLWRWLYGEPWESPETMGCPICDGTGKVACNLCRGTGRLEE